MLQRNGMWNSRNAHTSRKLPIRMLGKWPNSAHRLIVKCATRNHTSSSLDSRDLWRCYRLHPSNLFHFPFVWAQHELKRSTDFQLIHFHERCAQQQKARQIHFFCYARLHLSSLRIRNNHQSWLSYITKLLLTDFHSEFACSWVRVFFFCSLFKSP